MKDHFKALEALCLRWGGRLLEGEAVYGEYTAKAGDSVFSLQPDAFSLAPFTLGDLGILWDEKVIAYVRATGVTPCDIIHEMGHIFAVKGVDDSEVDFFGWEYMLARKLGLARAWVAQNGDYCIDDGGTSFKSLTKDGQRQFIDERVAFARSIGIVRGDAPVAVR